ncbi:MAG: RsmB/NOP family class I SAM-dependent RNA methyltransferase [Pseudomonadota bacterium]
MTPGARLAAAIEVLDAIAVGKGPADGVLKAWGKSHRFAGSKDRRAIAERVYNTLRARGRLQADLGDADVTARGLVLSALRRLDGLELPEIEALFAGGHTPASLSDAERARLEAPYPKAPDWAEAGVPAFLAEALKAQYGETWRAEAEALIAPRAPVDLRVNLLRGGREGALRLLAHDGFEAEASPLSALGLRLPAASAPDVQSTRAFTSGWIEVQDEGSQLAAALTGAKPGETVVDYCAGGGGKTLALAAMMRLRDDGAGVGRLIACDVSHKRLDAIHERLERAGARAEIRRTGPEGEGAEDLIGRCDLVLVDAPCSGAGTWRRRPEGAWRLVPEAIVRLSALQASILQRASRLVRPGGRLVYITCSVLAEENQAVAQGFLRQSTEFRAGSLARALASPLIDPAAVPRLTALAEADFMLQLTPHRSNTDGFFIALYERPL